MPTYFAFNDDFGKYHPTPTAKQLTSHPFYVRATLIVDSAEYKKLCNMINYRKGKHGLPKNREIKWSYPWSLRSHVKSGKEIDESQKFYFLREVDYEKVIDYIEDALGVLSTLDYKTIVISVTCCSEKHKYETSRMHQMHLETCMQRIEMSLNHDKEGLCILFMDPESKELDSEMRETYFKLRANGGLLRKYKKIKDSINFEDSNHSIGIQMADLIAGSFGSFFRSIDSDKYKRGKNMCISKVLPLVRSNEQEYFGYGICEVPTSSTTRARLKKMLT